MPMRVGDMKDKLDLRPLRPSAITAAIKGGQFDPAAHPPSPVYARDPDATLPEPRK
jgi:tRNA threonylcarbamoyladenosine biosynthesis protein TsaB